MHADWKECASIDELKAKLAANCCSELDGKKRTARKHDISDVIDRAIEISIESIAKDAARYKWLRDNGHMRRFAETASMSVGRGPYINIEVPSNNRFNSFILSGEFADSTIDFAMGEGK